MRESHIYLTETGSSLARAVAAEISGYQRQRQKNKYNHTAHKRQKKKGTSRKQEGIEQLSQDVI